MMRRISVLVSHARRMVARNGVSLAAVAIVTFLAFLAVVGPLLTPYDPYVTDLADVFSPPGKLHWFGTDQVGRDVLSRVVASTRIDLFVAICAVAASFTIGVGIGG